MNNSSAFLLNINFGWIFTKLMLMTHLKIHIVKILFALLVSINISIHAQTADSYQNNSENIPSVTDDLKSFLHTGEKLINSPGRFDKKDWIIFTSILALTASSTFLDQDNRDFWLNHRSPTLDDISIAGRLYGEISYAGLFSGSLYLGGKISRNKELAVTGRMLLEGLFYAGLTTTLIKIATGRSRPYTDEGHLSFKFFQTDNDYMSFPSGHSTIAFTLSSVLAHRINNTYASIGLYSLSLLTSWQRMYSDNHWLSDTIMGAVIGYFIGKAVVKFDDESNTDNSNTTNQEQNYFRYYELFSLKYSF